MSQTGSSVLGAGAAGLGAGAAVGAAGKRQPPPSNSAPSAYSQSQSHYAPSSDPGYDYNPAYAAYSDPHSNSGHGTDSTSPRSSAFPGGFQPGYGPPDHRGPSPGPSLPLSAGTSSSGPGTLPSNKEMEARNLRVANDGAGSSAFVQHQDGGRLEPTRENDDVPNEIPPSYDSVPRD